MRYPFDAAPPFPYPYILLAVPGSLPCTVGVQTFGVFLKNKYIFQDIIVNQLAYCRIASRRALSFVFSLESHMTANVRHKPSRTHFSCHCR